MDRLKEKGNLALPPINYILVGVGLLLIVIGFALMAGGKSEDPSVFSSDIFSFRRITLAPIIVLSGFIFQIFAILWKGKKEKVVD